MSKLQIQGPHHLRRRWIALLAAAGGLAGGAIAQPIGHCRFDPAALQFQGDVAAQASCLLRPVAKWGKVDATSATLPPALSETIGKPTGVLVTQLRAYLTTHKIDEAALGGSLSQELSHAYGGKPSATQAQYLVIHDTSSPWLGDGAFPSNDAALLNGFAGYGGPKAVAHMFVNRLGATFTGHDFAVPWRATKFENNVGTPAKGLFIHIELLQPRRRDPAGGPKNDAIAPQPGFTAAQYDKLALLYAVASARGGKWLIPAFHAAIDDGLDDAHDDPQNFELEQFATALATLRQRLAEPLATAERTPAARAWAAGTQAQTCSAIVSALAMLKPGEPLLAQSGSGKTWKALFDDCDHSDTFAGQPLPAHNGRALRCSTDRNQVALLSRYADGTVVFNAKAAVDADGSPVVGGSGWPNNLQTWLTFDKDSRDNFVNAEAVPFIVMPLAAPTAGVSLMKDTGIGKGDLAVVVKADRCSFAVVGDAGPWFRLGEASLRTHEDLGNPQCAVIGQSPCRRLKGGSGIGIPSDVTYIVFPGSRPKPLLSQTVNSVVEQAAGERALRFLSTNAK